MLTSATEQRPWGSFTVLLDTDFCKVKKLQIKPGQEISYQYHYKRQEEWTIVAGVGIIKLDDEKMTVYTSDHITILPKQKHTIKNNGDDNLIIIEVQTGTYFGEDDIVRITDKYGRK